MGRKKKVVEETKIEQEEYPQAEIDAEEEHEANKTVIVGKTTFEGTESELQILLRAQEETIKKLLTENRRLEDDLARSTFLNSKYRQLLVRAGEKKRLMDLEQTRQG